MAKLLFSSLVAQILNALREGFGLLRHAALRFLGAGHLRWVVFRPRLRQLLLRLDLMLAGRCERLLFGVQLLLELGLHCRCADDTYSVRYRTPDMRAAQDVVVPTVHLIAG